MRYRRVLQGIALLLVLAAAWNHSLAQMDHDSHSNSGVQSGRQSSEWVGELNGPFDSGSTTQSSHVTLLGSGSRLTGTWGAYTLAWSIEDGHVEIILTDAAGTMVGQLRGRAGADTFFGRGSVMSPPRAGSTAAPAWTDVSWKLTRAVAAPAFTRMMP